MKTLKEQYAEIVGGYNPQYTENVSNKCVEIALNYYKKLNEDCLPYGDLEIEPDTDDSLKDIKERAFNKIISTYSMMINENTARYYSSGVSEEIANQMVRSHQIELEVYSYILYLIRKDNI